MTPIDQFNDRMLANEEPFRLVQVSPEGPVAAPSDSYQIRCLHPGDDEGHAVCYEMHDVPEAIALQIAEAFFAGVSWEAQRAPIRD